MRRVGWALLVTVLVLALLEGAARLVHEGWLVRRTAEGVTSDRAPLLVPHPTRLFRFVEGPVELEGVHARIDADGLRMSARPGPAYAPLVLTLGDSSVFGHGVPDGQTLHDQLQLQLTRQGTPVRVRCGATPGYSTAQTRVLLDEVGWETEPDLLVVANLWSDSHLDRFRDAEVMARGAGPPSALYGLLRYGLDRLRGRPTAARVAWPTASDVGVRRVPLPEYRDHLDAIADDALARGIGVVFLGLPHAAWVEAGGATTGASAPYLATLRAVAEARGVPYVDGTAALLAAPRRGELFTDGLHPSAAGHRLLARALVTRLGEAGWPRARLVPLGGPSGVTVPEDPWDGTRYAASGSLRAVVEEGGGEPDPAEDLLPSPSAAGGEESPARGPPPR